MCQGIHNGCDCKYYPRFLTTLDHSLKVHLQCVVYRVDMTDQGDVSSRLHNSNSASRLHPPNSHSAPPGVSPLNSHSVPRGAWSIPEITISLHDSTQSDRRKRGVSFNLNPDVRLEKTRSDTLPKSENTPEPKNMCLDLSIRQEWDPSPNPNPYWTRGTHSESTSKSECESFKTLDLPERTQYDLNSPISEFSGQENRSENQNKTRQKLVHRFTRLRRALQVVVMGFPKQRTIHVRGSSNPGPGTSLATNARSHMRGVMNVLRSCIVTQHDHPHSPNTEASLYTG